MEKTIVKLGDNSSLNKQKVREERKFLKAKRISIMNEIDDLLKKVSHIPEITTEKVEKNLIDVADKKVFEKIFKLKEELKYISEFKTYEVHGETEIDQIIIEAQNSKQDNAEQLNIYNYEDNYITSCKQIDKITTVREVLKLRKTKTLQAIANEMKIDYPTFKNWCYRRGAKVN